MADKIDQAKLDQRFATLRSVACILLVTYHVIGAGPQDGLKVTQGPLRNINDLLALLRMPLFSVLAGWTYSIRPARPGRLLPFLKGKARRLLVPMFVVGSLYIVIQSFVPDVNHRQSALPFVWPLAHYWFIESLFLIFILVSLLDNARRLSSIVAICLVFAVACLVAAIGPFTMLFAIGGAIYLFPFFLLGLALHRLDLLQWLERPHIRILIAAGLITCIALLPKLQIDRFSVIALVSGILLCLLIVGIPTNIPTLARLSRFTYAIFLFHVFFTAGSRISLYALGVHNLLILITIGISVGLIGPIIAQMALERSPIAALLFLGRRLPQKRMQIGQSSKPRRCDP